MLKHPFPETHGARIFVSALPGYPLEDQLRDSLEYCERRNIVNPQVVKERDATPYDPWSKRPTLERLLSGRYEKKRSDGSFLDNNRLIVPVYECLSPKSSEFEALRDRIETYCALNVEAVHEPYVSWEFGVDKLRCMFGKNASRMEQILAGVHGAAGSHV